MSLSSDILEVLVSAGCKDNLPNADAFNASLEEGLRSALYRNLVAHLADELHQVYKTEERINKDSEINEFQMELSSFLKEMMCPFKEFVTGPMSDRFPTVESRLRLLEYLGSELMAARMCHVLNPTKSDQNVITINETQAAKSLKEITECLNVDNKTKATKELFNELNNQLEALLKKVGPNRTGKPLFAPTKPLTEKQWIELEEIQKDLDKDYGIRRELLLTRLDCTIQSFQWSDRLKNQGDAISEKYSAKRRQLDSLMKPGDETNIAALLAARDDLALIEKTACASVRVNTATRIQKHIIGQVPDRGGRADEVAPPPPEMPSWQKNRAQGGGGFGGGGGGGRGRGGGGEQRGRGGRGGGRGGGGAGGSAYEPNFQAKPQGNFQATLSYKPQGQYQNQGYQQQQQQPQQGHQQNNQQQGYQGGRVQGGWSQKGYNRPSSGGNDDEDNRGGNGYQGQGGQQQRRGRGRGGGQRY